MFFRFVFQVSLFVRTTLHARNSSKKFSPGRITTGSRPLVSKENELFYIRERSRIDTFGMIIEEHPKDFLENSLPFFCLNERRRRNSIVEKLARKTCGSSKFERSASSLSEEKKNLSLYVRFTGAKVICCSLLSDSSPSLGPRNLPLATRIRLLLFSSREDRRGRDGQADRITTRERGERKERREDRSLDLEGDGLWERLTRLMGPRHPGKYRRYPASIEVRLGCEPGCRCRFT